MAFNPDSLHRIQGAAAAHMFSLLSYASLYVVLQRFHKLSYKQPRTAGWS